MGRPMSLRDVVPQDDPAPAKKRRVKAEDIIAVVNAVAKGMPVESACNILCSMGMDEGEAMKMCNPAKASYEKSSAPVAPVNHVHLPKDAVRVEVHAPPAAAPIVHAGDVSVNVPEARRRSFVHTVHRNSQGRMASITTEEVEE